MPAGTGNAMTGAAIAGAAGDAFLAAGTIVCCAAGAAAGFAGAGTGFGAGAGCCAAGAAVGFASGATFRLGGTLVCCAGAGAGGFLLGGAIDFCAAGAAPPPFIAKPHLGHNNCAAAWSSAGLKSCEHVGFGHGIVFAIVAETFEFELSAKFYSIIFGRFPIRICRLRLSAQQVPHDRFSAVTTHDPASHLVANRFAW